MNDYAHYDECRTLMLLYKQRHMKRLYALMLMLLINMYLHVLLFGKKYAGTALEVVVWNTGGGAGSNYGIFVILSMVVIGGGGVLLFKKVKNNKIRIGFVIAAFAFLMGMTLLRQHGGAASAPEGGAAGVSHLAFGMGMATLFVSLVCIALAFFGEQKRRWLLPILLLLLVLGFLADFFAWWTAIPMVILYAAQIPENKKMRWMMTQPGYPYFIERFDEQRKHNEYEPLHPLDAPSGSDMPDAEEIVPYHSAAAVRQNAEKEPLVWKHSKYAKPSQPAATASYTMEGSDADGEMPGIGEITELPPEPEQPAPLPEPELPDADSIALPTWDTPDSGLDTGAILSNFPDVSTDIPDLPDIPDIPKL